MKQPESQRALSFPTGNIRRNKTSKYRDNNHFNLFKSKTKRHSHYKIITSHSPLRVSKAKHQHHKFIPVLKRMNERERCTTCTGN